MTQIRAIPAELCLFLRDKRCLIQRFSSLHLPLAAAAETPASVLCVIRSLQTIYLTDKTEKAGENMTTEKAWDYAVGLIKVDGLEPTEDFKKYIELEKQGKVTDQDLKKYLDKKYQMKEDRRA